MPASKRRPLADCAVTILPTAEELADIAISMAGAAERLLDERARVDLLSVSTRESAQHPSLERIRKALSIVRQRHPDLLIDGELQAAAALSPEIAGSKIADGGVLGGHANVLIFPDLACGNIAYELVRELGGAQAIGPFLPGFAEPVCDLGRGATVEDIVHAATIACSGV